MHQANTKNRCVGASLRNASARFFSSGLEGMHKGPRAKLADYYKESEVGQSNLHPRGGFFIHAILTKDFLSGLLIIVKLTILDKQLRNPKGERRRKEICTAIFCRMAEAARQQNSAPEHMTISSGDWIITRFHPPQQRTPFLSRYSGAQQSTSPHPAAQRVRYSRRPAARKTGSRHRPRATSGEPCVSSNAKKKEAF